MTPNIISIYQILILPAKSKQNKRKKIHLTTKSNNSYLLISLDHATAYSHTLILNYSVTNRFWLFVNPSRQGGVSSPPSYTIQHNENSPIVRHSLYPFMCCNCGESLCASRYLSPPPLLATYPLWCIAHELEPAPSPRKNSPSPSFSGKGGGQRHGEIPRNFKFSSKVVRWHFAAVHRAPRRIIN